MKTKMYAVYDNEKEKYVGIRREVYQRLGDAKRVRKMLLRKFNYKDSPEKRLEVHEFDLVFSGVNYEDEEDKQG